MQWPVSVASALMPDAHVGYGLPIGGVLATDNVVIPCAVGVDIACRMKLSVYGALAEWIEKRADGLRHLSWLSLDDDAGQECWQARQLMGEYAAANHAVIHDHIAEHLGFTTIRGIENHHNFARREEHEIDGVRCSVIVHRKGATPRGGWSLGCHSGIDGDPARLTPRSAETASGTWRGSFRLDQLDDIERSVDWILCLEKGRVERDGPLDSLQDRYARWRVLPRRFIAPATLSTRGLNGRGQPTPQLPE